MEAKRVNEENRMKANEGRGKKGWKMFQDFELSYTSDAAKGGMEGVR